MGNSLEAKSAQLFEQVFRIAASGNSQFVQLDDKIGTVDTSEGCAQNKIGNGPNPDHGHQATKPDVNKRGC